MASFISNESQKMMIINTGIPLILILDPNINSFKFSSQKIKSKTLTNTGYVVNHAGNDFDTISCSGSTYTKWGGESSSYSSLDYFSYLSSTLLFKMAGLSAQDIGAKSGPAQWGSVDARLNALYRAYKLDKERIGDLSDSIKNFTNIFIPEEDRTAAVSSNKDLLDSKSYIAARKGGYLSLSKTFIVYDNILYSGYFDRFELSKEAKTQRVTSYSFTFTSTSNTLDYYNRVLYDTLPSLRLALATGNVVTLLRYVSSFVLSGGYWISAANKL